MGCDIHVHVEIKRNGRWLHWSQPQVERNYHLFGKIAGVRDEDVEPIAPERGFPEDANETTDMCYRRQDGDAHTATWLTAAEAGEVQRWYEDKFPARQGTPPIWGYLFGNDVDSHIRYDDSKADLAEMGVEDVRVICWFDN